MTKRKRTRWMRGRDYTDLARNDTLIEDIRRHVDVGGSLSKHQALVLFALIDRLAAAERPVPRDPKEMTCADYGHPGCPICDDVDWETMPADPEDAWCTVTLDECDACHRKHGQIHVEDCSMLRRPQQHQGGSTAWLLELLRASEANIRLGTPGTALEYIREAMEVLRPTGEMVVCPDCGGLGSHPEQPGEPRCETCAVPWSKTASRGVIPRPTSGSPP